MHSLTRPLRLVMGRRCLNHSSMIPEFSLGCLLLLTNLRSSPETCPRYPIFRLKINQIKYDRDLGHIQACRDHHSRVIGSYTKDRSPIAGKKTEAIIHRPLQSLRPTQLKKSQFGLMSSMRNTLATREFVMYTRTAHTALNSLTGR